MSEEVRRYDLPEILRKYSILGPHTEHQQFLYRLLPVSPPFKLRPGDQLTLKCEGDKFHAYIIRGEKRVGFSIQRSLIAKVVYREMVRVNVPPEYLSPYSSSSVELVTKGGRRYYIFYLGTISKDVEGFFRKIAEELADELGVPFEYVYDSDE